MAHTLKSIYKCDRCAYEMEARWNTNDDAVNSKNFFTIEMKDGNEVMLCKDCYNRIIEFLKGESD